MDNIFSTLWKYRPQGVINPEENFFTESFKFILKTDPAFCDKFVKLIAANNLKPPFKIESQVIHGNSIIDLQISDRFGEKILVEIKVGAKQNIEITDEGNQIEQIEKYLRLKKGLVCFIERNSSEISDRIKTNSNFTGRYEWSQIYELLSGHIRSNKKQNDLARYFEESFINFMKQKNMLPFEKFTKEDMEISPLVPDLYERMEDFLEYAKNNKAIVGFCEKNGLEIGNPYFDAYRNLAVYFSKKGNRISSVCSFFMGFEYISQIEMEDRGHDSPGVYFFISILCPRIKNADIIRNKLVKPSPQFKKIYMDTDASNEIIYYSVFFPKFADLGREGMVKCIFKALQEMGKNGIIKAINPYLS